LIMEEIVAGAHGRLGRRQNSLVNVFQSSVTGPAKNRGRSFFYSCFGLNSLVCRSFLCLILAFFCPFLAAGALAFDLEGHRGARGLAPENTLAAFGYALKVGVTTLELDIGVTADGAVVIAHDPWLNPLITRGRKRHWLPGARGPLIKSLTLAQLLAYDVGRINPATAYARQFSAQQPQDGQRVPTLAQLFDLVKSSGADEVRFNIETKISPLEPGATVSPEAMTSALLAAVRAAGMTDRVTIQSFDWRTLRLVHKMEPGMATSCLSSQGAGGDTLRDGMWTAGMKSANYDGIPAMVKAAGCTTWSPNQGALTERQVELAHAHGLQVLPWTVNAASHMRRLLDWRVDGIITDYPDRLRNLMEQRGMLLPPAVP
jgi:glycerophosphoryl diester phosphodiesterase